MANEVVKLIFAVLDVSFNSGPKSTHVVIKRQICTLVYVNKMQPLTKRSV